MADDAPEDSQTQAAELVRVASDEEFIELSKAQAEILVDAVERDMITLADKVNDDEDRLAKLETQTRVLSEAVIAITRIDERLAPAIRAVQDEMHGRRRAMGAKLDSPPGGARRTVNRTHSPGRPPA
jgi:hypothetical protein